MGKRKINSKQKAVVGMLSLEQFYVTVGFAMVLLVAVVMVWQIMGSNMNCIIVATVITVCMAILWAKFVFDESRLHRTILHVDYFVRGIRDKNEVHKYCCSLEHLQSFIPVIGVHGKNGIIEYTDDQYGVIYKYTPSRISDDEVNIHNSRVEEAIKSLHGDLSMTFFSCSRVDHSAALANMLLEALNDDEKSKEQKKHLYELYKEVSSDTAPKIDWEFFFAIMLGKHDNAKLAQSAHDSQIPGILKSLRIAHITTVAITHPDDIARAYRQCILQEVV